MTRDEFEKLVDELSNASCNLGSVSFTRAHHDDDDDRVDTARKALLDAFDTMQKDNARIRVALKALVDCNERWNADVASIIGRPPNWNDSYLDAARDALRSPE